METPTKEEMTEKSLVTAGQRRINILWEVTQSIIALSVVLTSLYVAANLAIKGEGERTAFLLLSNTLFVVIGFYFGRTNHQRTGGIGNKDSETR